MLNFVAHLPFATKDHILFMTAESLKHGLAMKLMPGQLLSSKHLALCRKVDHWSEQQLKIASSHEDSGLFVLLLSVCRLLMLFMLLLITFCILLLLSILGRPNVDVTSTLKIDKTLNWRNCIVGRFGVERYLKDLLLLLCRAS